MIVYGGGSIIRSGLLQRIEDSLQQAGVDYVKLGGVQPNPTDPKVYEGIELARKEGVDFMLPVGGGSVIDTAKAIAAGVPYEGDFWDFYIGKAKVKKALKVGVVLTIPAAGSEGSGNTVITKLEGLQKLSLRVPELLRPVFAVMNPELTYTLPPFTQPVTDFYIGSVGKITFHNVYHHIGNATSCLVGGESIGQ